MTIIQPTKEHTEALDKLYNAILTSSVSCNESKIKQCRIEANEAFETLAKLADENKLYETIDKD